MSDDIDFKYALSLVQYYWKLLVLFGLICGGVSYYVVNKYFDLSYTSSIMLSAWNNDNNKFSSMTTKYQNAQIGELLANDCKELIKCPKVKKGIADKLREIYPTPSLLPAYSCSIEAKRGSRIMTIVASSKNPEFSRNLAVSASKVFADAVSEVFKLDLKLIDQASPPVRIFKYRPVYISIFLGILGAAVLFIFLPLGKLLSQTIKTPEEVAMKLPVQVFGTIPKISNVEMQYMDSPHLEGSKKTKKYGNFLCHESFNLVASELFNSEEKNGKTRIIAISSSIPGEGKSFIVSNLGKALARGNRRVLILDCDMRRPRIHKIFNISNDIGLALLDKENLNADDMIVPFIQDNIRIDIIPSGPVQGNSFELLSGNILKDFISNIAYRYDYILLDTPPVLGVSDTTLISKLADQFYLVLSSQKTKLAFAERSISQLKHSNININGIIFNKFNSKTSPYYYSYGSY